MMGAKVSAILLASGLSRRIGTDKLLLPYKGRTLLQHALDLLSDLPVYEKILVISPARLGKMLLPPGILVKVNPHPMTGQSGSLRLGVLSATGEGYLCMNADQPKLTLMDILPLLNAAKDNKGKIIYPAIEGEPRTPTLFPAGFRGELLALTGDTGGRAVRALHPENCIAVEAERPENFTDIDNRTDYLTLMYETI